MKKLATTAAAVARRSCARMSNWRAVRTGNRKLMSSTAEWFATEPKLYLRLRPTTLNCGVPPRKPRERVEKWRTPVGGPITRWVIGPSNVLDPSGSPVCRKARIRVDQGATSSLTSDGSDKRGTVRSLCRFGGPKDPLRARLTACRAYAVEHGDAGVIRLNSVNRTSALLAISRDATLPA